MPDLEAAAAHPAPRRLRLHRRDARSTCARSSAAATSSCTRRRSTSAATTTCCSAPSSAGAPRTPSGSAAFRDAHGHRRRARTRPGSSLRGLKTLEVRVARQTETATALADAAPRAPRRADRPLPGLRRPPLLRRRRRRAPRARVETGTQLIANATSLGGVTSTMESRHRWEGDRVPPGLLRLSVGLEPVEELWADLEQALEPRV